MKYIVFAILFTLGFGTLQAQDVYTSSGRSVNNKRRPGEKEGFDPSKLIWGGGLIFGAGNGMLNVGASPILGYRLTDRFSAGIGVGYQYVQLKDYLPYLASPVIGTKYYTVKTSLYSANVWARYLVWNNIFLQVQPEMNTFQQFGTEDVALPYVHQNIIKNRVFVPSMLVGGGIRQPISERVSFVGVILYDVLQDKNSLYKNTIDFRFGINVGF